MSDKMSLISSGLPSYMQKEEPSNWCTKRCTPEVASTLLFGTASVGCSVVVILNPSDTAQILCLMGASGCGWQALQSFFKFLNAPQTIYISREVVKILAPFIAFGGTEESLNVKDKTRGTIFLIWVAYLAPLSILSIKNTFHERLTAFLEVNSEPFLKLSNNSQIEVEDSLNSVTTSYSIPTYQKIVYCITALSGIGFLVGARCHPTSLIDESFNSTGWRQLGFALGHLTEELILQTQAKVDCEMRKKRNDPRFIFSNQLTSKEHFFRALTYIPKATPMLSAILFSFPSWWTHALIGLLSGCTVKYNRSLLKERNSFREFSLEPRVQQCFNVFKAMYLITMLVLLTEFYVPIMKQSKLDAENFGSFEPAVIIGALGTMGSSLLVKKRGLDSEISKIAFSIFVLNAFLFGNFFFWVLNDPNVGMSNEDVSTTTIIFSSMAWGSLGLAFGTELGSCMTNELKPLLGKTYLPMSLFLLWRYTIEHLLGNE